MCTFLFLPSVLRHTKIPTHIEYLNNIILADLIIQKPVQMVNNKCSFLFIFVLGAPVLPRYKMNSNPRGYCVIINNMEFSKQSMNRESSVYDEELLRELFEDLSFTVVVKHDLKYNEILDTATEFAGKDHSDYNAFFMIILSHGANGDTILGVNGKKISIEDVMSEFKPTNCPTLLNKPKVFFIQACRGGSNEHLVAANDLCDGFVADAFACDSTIARTASPSEADFLLAFSTTPGYVSWRQNDEGSIFVQVSEKMLILPIGIF